MVYIFADANFSNGAAAKKINLTIEQYNQKLIQNWNAIVNKDDYVVLLGNIGEVNYSEMKSILLQLNGTPMILDYDIEVHSPAFSKQQWIEMGVQPYKFSASVSGKIKGVNQKAVILSWNDEICRNQNYCAAAGSTIQTQEIIDGNTLNLSIEHWDYSPVPYNSVPKLINNALMLKEEMPNER